jgi:hypothetical protein
MCVVGTSANKCRFAAGREEGSYRWGNTQLHHMREFTRISGISGDLVERLYPTEIFA